MAKKAVKTNKKSKTDIFRRRHSRSPMSSDEVFTSSPFVFQIYYRMWPGR